MSGPERGHKSNDGRLHDGRFGADEASEAMMQHGGIGIGMMIRTGGLGEAWEAEEAEAREVSER